MVILRFSVRSLSLDLETDARALCLFGPSGSGKTTCLETVAGLLRPREGLIRFGDRTFFGPGVDLPPRERDLGYLPQESSLFPHLDVRRNLLYGAETEDCSSVAAALDLETLLPRAPRSLSGGQGRRVSLGRALLRRPFLLLLDEPFTGLDAPLRAQLLVFLARRPVPHVLLVTHDPRDALALADEVVRLEAGRVVERGGVADVFGPSSDLVEPTSLVRARVASRSDPYAEVDADGLRLTAHLPGATDGEEVRLALRADDVTLTLGPHADSSARNQIPVRVAALARRREQVLATLDGGLRIHALLDPRSVETLRLRPGVEVFAQFKASALTRAGL